MTVKRFILAAAFLILAVCASAALALMVVYHHPATVKRLMEDALSARFGVEVTVGALEYGLKPMQIRAANIAVSDPKSGSTLDLRVSGLNAALALEGPFGRRTLVIENVALTGVSVIAGGRMNWREALPDTGPPSALSRLIKRGGAALLFRDVRIGMVALTGGEGVFDSDELKITLHRIHADTASGGIRVGGDARVQWPAAGAAVDAPQFDALLNLGFSVDQNTFSGRLNMPEVRYTGPQATASAAASEARLALVFGPERITITEARVGCRSLTLSREGAGKLSLNTPRLSAAGAFERKLGALQLARWQLAIDDLLDVGGEAELTLGAARALDIRRVDGVVFPAKMIPQVLAAAGYKNAPVQVSGAVGVKGRFSFRETGRGWVEEGDVTAAFDRNAVKAVSGPLTIEGVVSGTVQGSGPAAAPVIAARLSGRQIRLGGSVLDVAPFAVEVSAKGTYPDFSVPLLEVRAPAAALTVSGKVYTLKDIVLSAAKGKFAADKRSVSCPEITLSSDVLRNLTASLVGDPRQMTLEVSGTETGWALAAARFALWPAGWRFGGVDRLQARAVIRPGGESRLSTTIALSGLSFADAGDRFVGEDIALRAEVTVSVHGKGDAIAVAAALNAGGGELLLDRFYLNPGKNPVTLSADLGYAMSGRRLQINGARLEIENLLALDVGGHLAREGAQTDYDLTLQVAPAPAAPLFAALIAEPLRYRQPALAAMQVDGRLSAQIHVAAEGQRRSVRGQADWQSGSLETAGKAIRLEGITLRLPLWYQSGGGDSGDPPMKGSLAVSRVAVPMLPDQALELPFEVRLNQLSTTGDLRVRFPAGEVRIGAVSIRDLFGPIPKVDTRLTVERIQVGEFLKGLWAAPVDAVVSGELAEVVFDGRDVRTRGRLVADIFKGQVIFQNPGVDAAFSAARNLRADCLVQNLSLAEATQDTAFGRIQGILGGRIEHLEIVGGQPQRFNLLLETIRTQGVPQRINVKAVENIARIGGGQTPFIGLAGNLVSFFREFTYDKIGVRAVLENDHFKVNGAIKEGGVEYLVKRGGIPGVDVVNLNPANQISFKDMVKRIRRVTGSKTGPVVN